jgi:hypothetical protein
METASTSLNRSEEQVLIKEILDHEPLKVKNEKYSPEREIFILSYKKGHEVIKVYFQAESLADAVSTGQQFCAKKRYRFIVVTPLLRDLKRAMNEED